MGIGHHHGRGQRVGKSADDAGDTLAQCRPGEHLLLLDHALHGLQLVGFERVDDHACDRDERRRGGYFEHRQFEYITCGKDSRGHGRERGASVDGQGGCACGRQAFDVAELCRLVDPHVDTRGHHQLAAVEIRCGICQLDGVGPGDLPVGGVLPRDQCQPEALDLSQAPRGDGHAAMVPATRRGPDGFVRLLRRMR